MTRRHRITLALTVALITSACADGNDNGELDIIHRDTLNDDTSVDTAEDSVATTSQDTSVDAPEDTPEDATAEDATEDATEDVTEDATEDTATSIDPPTAVTAMAGSSNHTIDISWSAASGAISYHLYYDSKPITDTSGTPEIISGTSFTHADRDLAATWYYRVVAVATDGTESALSDEASAQSQLAFAGESTDFREGDAFEGLATGSARTFYATWSDEHLFFGTAGDLTSNQDVFAIAIDTGSGGSNALPTIGENSAILPFDADYILELRPNGENTTSRLRTWSGSDWTDTDLSATTSHGPHAVDGTVDQVAIEASAIGSPTALRFALIDSNSNNGYVFATAPDNSAQAHDVFGFFASITAGLDVDAPWQPHATLDAGTTLVEADALVTFAVDATGKSGDIHVLSDTRPFSKVLSNSVYELVDDATHGDTTSGDNVFSARFNLGGSTEPVYFAFTVDGVSEFTGTERVFTPSGSNEDIAPVTWGQHYSATHGANITFRLDFPSAPGNPVFLRGQPTPLTWSPGTEMTLSSGTYNTPITFTTLDGAIAYKYYTTESGGADLWETFTGDRALDLDVVGALSGGNPTRGSLTLPVDTWSVK